MKTNIYEVEYRILKGNIVSKEYKDYKFKRKEAIWIHNPNINIVKSLAKDKVFHRDHSINVRNLDAGMETIDIFGRDYFVQLNLDHTIPTTKITYENGVVEYDRRYGNKFILQDIIVPCKDFKNGEIIGHIVLTLNIDLKIYEGYLVENKISNKFGYKYIAVDFNLRNPIDHLKYFIKEFGDNKYEMDDNRIIKSAICKHNDINKNCYCKSNSGNFTIITHYAPIIALSTGIYLSTVGNRFIVQETIGYDDKNRINFYNSICTKYEEEEFEKYLYESNYIYK